MNSKFLLLFTFIIPLLFCGCSSITIPNGKYDTTIDGREDFVAIYNDIIYLRIKQPDDDRRINDYWEWAGNFKIADDGRFFFKMDDDTARKWNFSYEFSLSNGMISVYDISAENSFHLRRRQPRPTHNSYPPAMNHHPPAQPAPQGDFSTYN